MPLNTSQVAPWWNYPIFANTLYLIIKLAPNMSSPQQVKQSLPKMHKFKCNNKTSIKNILNYFLNHFQYNIGNNIK